MTAAHRDRRSGERFPIQMSLRYRPLLDRRTSVSAIAGKVVDISNTGALIFPPTGHPPGTPLDVAIDWPVLYDEAFRIVLAVIGSVVRNDERGTAIQFARQAFEPWRDVAVPEAAHEVAATVRE